MDSQTKDDLLAVRALVQSSWTKGAMARNKQHFFVDINDPSACKFCLLGATIRAIPDPARQQNVRRYLTHTLQVFRTKEGRRYFDLIDFNDRRGRTQSEVLYLIDKTIAEQETVNVPVP